MKEVRWGIIGCGKVTEVKSGPAFYKVKGSKLVAVMRRDVELAKNYAKRHNVPKYYDNADDLINDIDVNAVYIATPPSSHKEYTIKAAKAGKAVYVEKPMAINYL
ncbi:Gfo/Idh/MocA family protein [Francisella sp. SYW-9]|uniref:Gfo/Idh/MocA family protein n=1 Tax=Francisella sp. SYW-9 TaxID=2610888 RepID=UPI001CD0D2F4|nr:Gfo/Idh/MocA family oxidoreductase [Francisella sp. SYW-9]